MEWLKVAKEHRTIKEMWKKYLSTIGENINDTGKTYRLIYRLNRDRFIIGTIGTDTYFY